MQTTGSIDDFERLIGPVAAIQRAWYAHLLALRAAAATPRTADTPTAPR